MGVKNYMKNNNWQTDLETYICQGEPDKVEKTNAWKAAIGLQDVDGLKIKVQQILIQSAKIALWKKRLFSPK